MKQNQKSEIKSKHNKGDNMSAFKEAPTQETKKMDFKWNMSPVDLLIRLVISIALGMLIYKNVIFGDLASLLLIVVAILFITSAVGFCPIYFLLGINTKKPHRK